MSSILSGSASLGGPTGNNQSLKGTGYKQVQMQNFTPDMMRLLQQMYSQVSPDSYLGKLAGGDQSTFDQIEAPSLRQFSSLQGNTASRFSGSMGGRKSSGFQNTMSSASAELAEKLAGNRQSLQQQAIKDLMGMSSNLLQQRPFENTLVPKQKPFWQELLAGLSQAAGQAGGTAASMAMFL